MIEAATGAVIKQPLKSQIASEKRQATPGGGATNKKSPTTRLRSSVGPFCFQKGKQDIKGLGGLLGSGGTGYTIPNARTVAGKRSGQECLAHEEHL
jgi:hypothetical protein